MWRTQPSALVYCTSAAALPLCIMSRRRTVSSGYASTAAEETAAHRFERLWARFVDRERGGSGARTAGAAASVSFGHHEGAHSHPSPAASGRSSSSNNNG